MVILVDKNDQPIGTEYKMAAHEKGLLHRAFSIFVFNNKGELLLQQRALNKYHSAGLWTNTCCSHPFPEEPTLLAAQRRLQEEMGMDIPLYPLFTFYYRAPFSNGLTEHEIDHVYIGFSDKLPVINPEEVASYYYDSLQNISEDMDLHPEQYTEWFKIILDKFRNEIIFYYKNNKELCG